MRILHISDAYLPKQGGIEVQVHDLATRQRAAGHEVCVLTCAALDHPPAAAAGNHTAATAAEDGGHLRVQRMRSPWGRVRRTNARLHELLRIDQPDVVHVHLSVLSPLSILGVRAAARAGVPVVATLHSLWWFAAPLYAIADLLLRWSRWRVQWTAVSELAAAPLRGVLRHHAEVSILPNGIDPAIWQIEPSPHDPADVVVVTVMRLASRKRPRPLLRAFRQALDQLPDSIRLRLIVIGDGPLRTRLERDIVRLRLGDTVELRGGQRHDQIRDLYRQADVYIAPAVLESFGIAALEARSAGLPVIARQQTGIADFIRHREHGLLAPNDGGLARALVELAQAPRLRARMSATNRASAPEWGWEDVMQRCEIAYKVAHDMVWGG